MIHSSQHKTARDHIGKKVVVVAGEILAKPCLHIHDVKSSRKQRPRHLRRSCRIWRRWVGRIFPFERFQTFILDVTMYQRSSIYIMSQKATIGMFRGQSHCFLPNFFSCMVWCRLCNGGNSNRNQRCCFQLLPTQTCKMGASKNNQGVCESRQVRFLDTTCCNGLLTDAKLTGKC